MNNKINKHKLIDVRNSTWNGLLLDQTQNISDLDFLSLSKLPLILTLNLIQWHTYNIKEKEREKGNASDHCHLPILLLRSHLRICLLFLNIQNYSRTKTTTPIL